MFGTYRYILALMVILHHLKINWWTGAYAVFGFYMLSGYLMTLVLNKTYGFSFQGTIKFSINRILRIYPPYLFVVLIAILIVNSVPQLAHEMNAAFRLPNTTHRWVENIFIFGLMGSKYRLVPPAWSLNVELVFYALIGLFFARNKYITYIWFALSLSFTVYMVLNDYHWYFRYWHYFGASLPFSIGASLYFLRERLSKLPISLLYPVMAIFALNATLANTIWKSPRMAGFYVSLFTAAFLLSLLAKIRYEDFPGWAVKVDKFLGNMAYPIFLCHWHVSVLVVWLFYSGRVPENSWLMFISSFIFINLLGFLIHYLIERNVNRLRNIVRGEMSQRSKSILQALRFSQILKKS